MTRKIRPLPIAIGAAILLVAVLAADIAMNRSYGLDYRNENGEWVTIVDSPFNDRRSVPYGGGTASIDPNGTVEMRVRVDNGYAWGFNKEYVLYANGAEVARGMLEAPARSSGTATFTVAGSAFFGGQVEFPKANQDITYTQLELLVAGEHIYGSMSARKA